MAKDYEKVLCPQCGIGRLERTGKDHVKCNDSMCGSAFPIKRFSKPGEAKKIDEVEQPKG